MHGALLIINVTEIRALIRVWMSWWFDSFCLIVFWHRLVGLGALFAC